MVNYKGKTYSTLSDVSVSSYQTLCQSGWITMPSGWNLAPDNADTRYLASAYTWSTDVIVLSSGKGIRTKKFPPSGIEYGDSQLKYVQNGNQYMVPYCSYQILITQTGCPSGYFFKK